MRRSAGLWLCLLMLLLPLAAQAGNPALAKQLERAASLLNQAGAQPAQRAALAREALGLLPADACPTVRQVITTTDRPTLDRARREVGALRQAVSLTPAGSVTAADAAKTLGTVLSSNAFQSFRRSEVPPFFRPVIRWLNNAGAWLKRGWDNFWKGVGKVLEAIGHWFGKLFRSPNLPPPPKTPVKLSEKMNSGLITMLWVLLGVAVLFIVGFVASHLLAAARRRQAMTKDTPRESNAPANRKQEPTYWERSLQQAQALWEAGDEREAVRALARACLVLLDARGLLRYDEARANGEVLRELRRQRRAPVLESLRPVVRSFDRSWYGFLPVSEDEFAGVLESMHRFREAVVGEG